MINRKMLATLAVTALTAGGALVSTMQPADAQWRRGRAGPAIAAGVIGGLALGAIAGAAAQPRYYGGYGYEGGYDYPPVAYPDYGYGYGYSESRNYYGPSRGDVDRGYYGPTYGYAAPTYGYAAPAYGYAAPAYGYAAPAYGYEPAYRGYGSGYGSYAYGGSGSGGGRLTREGSQQ